MSANNIADTTPDARRSRSTHPRRESMDKVVRSDMKGQEWQEEEVEAQEVEEEINEEIEVEEDKTDSK